MADNIKTAVFPVAGNGLRALPGSKAIPKHFHFVAGNPIIHYCVQEALLAGIEKFIFVVNSDPISTILLKRQFLDFSDTYKLLIENGREELIPALEIMDLTHKDVYFVEQRVQNGLGGAVLAAKELLKEESKFSVLCPDDLILPLQGGLREMVNKSNGYSAIVGIEETTDEELKKFGVVSMDEKSGQINYVIEKPKTKEQAPSNLVITGRFIFPNNVLDVLERNTLLLSKGQYNYTEVGLSDALENYINNKELIGVLIKGQRFDCGNRIGSIEANFVAALLDKQLRNLVLNNIRKYTA
ncbi:sugar phosphate nucleotidyltransferase [Fibrisoma limi]|nr:sugar phosphate nucleotidyltransferase [Fibrisoma limi]